jgi:hypothetical protein
MNQVLDEARRGCANFRKRTDRVFVANFFIVAVLSFLYFIFFSSKVDGFPGDAKFNAALTSYRLEEVGTSISLRSDFLFGSGTMQWGYLFGLEPTALFGNLFSTSYNFCATSVLSSILLFSVSFFFFNSYEFKKIDAIIASYLLTTTSIWSFSLTLTDDYLFAHVPQYASLLSFALIGAICFRNIGKSTIANSAVWTLFLLIDLIYLIWVFPQIFATTILLCFAVILSSFFKTGRRANNRIHQIFGGVIVCVGLFLVGAHSYIAGFYLNTAASETPVTVFNRPNLSNKFDFLLESVFPSPSPAGSYLFQQVCLLCFFGYLLAGFFRKQYRSGIWYGLFFALLLLLSYRIYQTQWIHEKGPNHNYIVWMIGPFYAGTLSLVLCSLARVLVVKKDLSQWRKFLWFQKHAGYLVFMPVLALIASPLSSVRFVDRETRSDPIVSDGIANFLAEKLSLKDNSKFRGRAGYLEPFPEYPQNIKARVPLLNDYSHNLTPLAFSFYQKLILDGAIQQRRNHFDFEFRNLNFYRLLGVRYLISETLPDADVLGMNNTIGIAVSPFGNRYVLDLGTANNGDYSPIKIRYASSLRETIEIIGSQNFLPQRDVILENSLNVDLVSVSNAKLQIQDGKARSIARSSGISLLVLPIEFSECLVFSGESDSSNLLSAYRVDGMLTGLLFERELDISIDFKYRLFGKSECRLNDLAYFRQFSQN